MTQQAISIQIFTQFLQGKNWLKILIEIRASIVFVLSQSFPNSIRNDWYFAFWVNIDWT